MGQSYKVILDSNFLMLPFQFKTDIFAELDRILDVDYKIFVTRSVINELKKLAKSKGKERMIAKAAIKLADRFEVIEDEGETDNSLYALSSPTTIICTNDKNLKEKIRKKGSPVIYLRQGKYLVLEGQLV